MCSETRPNAKPENVRRSSNNMHLVKLSVIICFLFLNIACSNNRDYYEVMWKSNRHEFETIVSLVKNEKLPVIYGRSGYMLPDSFKLRSIVGSLVFQETDFTYDSTYSILFRIGFDTSKVLRYYPTIVYTNNSKRIAEYTNSANSVYKFDEYWYFLPSN